MKRLVVSVILLVSAFACSGTPEVEPSRVDAAPLSGSGTAVALSEDQSDAQDDLVHTVPVGAFTDVASFCATQMKIVAPKIAEANAAFEKDGYGKMNLTPKCVETPDVLARADVALAKPFAEVKAVTFETGYSTESYLLVRASEGWSAVRAALVYANHNDPGCGSIERPVAITEVHVEQGALVIKTTADRTWLGKTGELGDLTMTYARACRALSPSVDVACGTPEVIDAKVVIRDEENPDAPVVTRFFATTYAVGGGVAIEPARRFADEQLDAQP